MRIYLKELRKIFNLRVMLIAAAFLALSLIWYENSVIDNFDRDNLYSYEHYYALDLIERYGSTLEADEFEGVKDDYNKLLAQADEYIASKEVYSKYGIHNYNELKQFLENGRFLPSGEDLFDSMPDEDKDAIFYFNFDGLEEKLQNHKNFMWYYNKFSPYESKALFSPAVMNTLSDFSHDIMIFLPIFIVILISPMLVNENMSGMRDLQYTSKIGKKLLHYQLAAVISATWIASLIYISVFLAAHIPTGSAKFLNVPIQNFRTVRYIGQLPFNWTLGQYLLVITICISLFMTGFSLILFVISHYSGNYISLITKVIPVTALVCYVGFGAVSYMPYGMKILTRCKYDGNDYKPLEASNLPPYNFELIIAIAILIVIGALLYFFTINHKKKLDLKIYLNELKKFLHPIPVLLALLLLVMYYYLFVSFYVDFFPNGHPHKEDFDLASEMTVRYGAALEEDEYREFVTEKEQEFVSEADKYIAGIDELAEFGITNWDDYNKIHSDSELYDKLNEDEKFNNAQWKLYEKGCDHIGFKLQALQSLKECYEGNEEYSDIETQLEKNGSSIMPFEVQEILPSWAINIMAAVLIGIVVIIAPMSTLDNISNIRSLQYTGKKGRKLLYTQLLATVSCSFVIITLISTVLISIFSTKHTQIFWNNKLNSFLGNGIYPDITMGQYVIIGIVMIYLFALGVAMFVHSLSLCSSNYTALVIKLIPLTVAAIALGNHLFANVYELYTGENRIINTFITCVITCPLIFIAGLATSLIIINRKTKKELSNL